LHVRQRLFHTYWSGADVDDAATIAGLPSPATGARIAARSQAEWSALDRPIVPAMMLPNGYMSRGLGVLARLADHLDE
jgi:hypothetical protein